MGVAQLPPTTLLTRNNKKRGVYTQSLYFRTLAMPCLNYYYELFYKDSIKIVPRILEDLLTARGAFKKKAKLFFLLAYWIMDDFNSYYYIECYVIILMP